MKILLPIRQLWQWHHLLWYLVKSDLKVAYKNKLLGFLWSILDPLMMMVVYVILVQYIFKRGGPQFPVLLFSALLAWRWFVYSLQQATTSLTSKAKLIQTVAFPKVVLPTQHVVTGFMKYLFSLGALLPMLFIFDAHFTLNLLWLPLIVLIQFLFTWGLSMICSILGVYFRDLQNILQFSLRMWFYLSPGLYSVADRIPERLQSIYMLNPFAALFNAYKNVLVRGEPPSFYIWIALGVGLLFVVLGLLLYAQKDPHLAKEV